MNVDPYRSLQERVDGDDPTFQQNWRLSTSCPVCSVKIGMWQGIQELTPFKITCPHCATVLRIELPGIYWILPIAGVPFLAMLAAGIWFFIQDFRGWAALSVVGAFIVLFVVEFIVGLLIFTYAKFVPKSDLTNTHAGDS